MAGMNLGDVQIFFIRKGEPPDPKGCSLFFIVGNADELCEFPHRANGLEIIEPLA